MLCINLPLRGLASETPRNAYVRLAPLDVFARGAPSLSGPSRVSLSPLSAPFLALVPSPSASRSPSPPALFGPCEHSQCLGYNTTPRKHG